MNYRGPTGLVNKIGQETPAHRVYLLIVSSLIHETCIVGWRDNSSSWTSPYVTFGHGWIKFWLLRNNLTNNKVNKRWPHDRVSTSLKHRCNAFYIPLSTMRPRKNGRHFADDIFKCIFLNENVWIPIEISLMFVPKGPIDNIPSLV